MRNWQNVNLGYHDPSRAEVPFLFNRPALHFLAAVFRDIAGDLVRADHAEAASVGVLAQGPQLGLGVLAAVLGRDPGVKPGA